MAIITCGVCGKRMVTQDILVKHMAKTHPAKEEVVAPVSTPVVEEKVEEMVTIKSADNRRLEVSVGNSAWNAPEIQVPKAMAGEVRRILLEGGFFLKD
jgi:hypothetical protein